jgi:hypothetical protein
MAQSGVLAGVSFGAATGISNCRKNYNFFNFNLIFFVLDETESENESP